MFGSPACSQIRETARSLLNSLAQAGRETLAVFEEAVEKDSSRTVLEDGSVYPLTSYVINYIKFLFEYARKNPTPTPRSPP